MSYDFSNLAPADFEDLARDLVGRELHMRFEAFGPGPDGGVDGRHAKGRFATILQAKHYGGSPFTILLSAMKRERRAIDRLAPARYVLATSRPLTPSNKNSLEKAIGPALKAQDDIFAAGDLNGLLRKRAYIFEEARRISEYLADDRVDISKYVLNVNVYTRRIRARILYNHLLVAKTPAGHIQALIESGKIPEIIDHENYNPRVIEWMTDTMQVNAIAPEQYAEAFIKALANPKKLWDTAFRTHIPEKCRHLLFALFFGSEYGEYVPELRLAYQSLHPHLCAKYGQPHDPKDFEESLRILEGGFITIDDSMRSDFVVSFVNPSIRDYLTDYLNDLEQLKDFATTARQGEWARQLWYHGKKIASEHTLADFARAFHAVAREFVRIPTLKKLPRYPHSYGVTDLANTDRIELLIEWWEATGDEAFARLATDLAANPVSGFTSWWDGTELIELLRNLKNSGYYNFKNNGHYHWFPFEEEMVAALEDGVITMLNGGVGSDDLEQISAAITGAEEILGPDIIAAAKEAIRREFDEIDRMVAETDSESTLEEHKATLKKLAPRAGISNAVLTSAMKIVDERISAIAEEAEEAEKPSFSGAVKKESEKFDDSALLNLFASLLPSG
jgi:hypothetical protein